MSQLTIEEILLGYGMRSDVVGLAVEAINSLKPIDRKPVAWYVRRNAPGMRDDGRKMGPFWRESDADDWVDENHTKHPLYD